MATSLEKLDALERELHAAEPAQGPGAMLQLMLEQAAPLVRPMLPDDPAELDALLTQAGEWVLGLRSDTAAAPA
jgi:hypothetical protein